MGLVKSDDDFYLSKRGHRFTKITYTNELQSWLSGGHRISSWGVIGLAGKDQSMIWFKIAEEISQYTGSTFKISTSSYVILRCEFFVKKLSNKCFYQICFRDVTKRFFVPILTIHCNPNIAMRFQSKSQKVYSRKCLSKCRLQQAIILLKPQWLKNVPISKIHLRRHMIHDFHPSALAIGRTDIIYLYQPFWFLANFSPYWGPVNHNKRPPNQAIYSPSKDFKCVFIAGLCIYATRWNGGVDQTCLKLQNDPVV